MITLNNANVVTPWGGEYWVRQDGDQWFSCQLDWDQDGGLIVQNGVSATDHWIGDINGVDAGKTEPNTRQRAEWCGRTTFKSGQTIRWTQDVMLPVGFGIKDVLVPPWAHGEGSGAVVWQAHAEDRPGAVVGPPYMGYLYVNTDASVDIVLNAQYGPSIAQPATSAVMGRLKNLPLGQWITVDQILTFDAAQGSALVLVNGVKAVDYHGPMGFADAGVYLKFGVYRVHDNPRRDLSVRRRRVTVSAA